MGTRGRRRVEQVERVRRADAGELFREVVLEFGIEQGLVRGLQRAGAGRVESQREQRGVNALDVEGLGEERGVDRASHGLVVRGRARRRLRHGEAAGRAEQRLGEAQAVPLQPRGERGGEIGLVPLLVRSLQRRDRRGVALELLQRNVDELLVRGCRRDGVVQRIRERIKVGGGERDAGEHRRAAACRDDMGQFMRHEVPAGFGPGHVRAGPNDHVATDRERPRAQQPGAALRRHPFVNADVGKVCAGARLVPLPLVAGQRPAAAPRRRADVRCAHGRDRVRRPLVANRSIGCAIGQKLVGVGWLRLRSVEQRARPAAESRRFVLGADRVTPVWKRQKGEHGLITDGSLQPLGRAIAKALPRRDRAFRRQFVGRIRGWPRLRLRDPRSKHRCTQSRSSAELSWPEPDGSHRRAATTGCERAVMFQSG